ncbi:MAG: hypothetical protein EXQ74_04230 [Thermoleophilia bacterium]|nr:hypothetical protein [Thermoleophilia bacterium]
MSDDVITLALENPDIILMRRPESPALVHGRIAPDAHPALAALWANEAGTKGTARVERRGDGTVVIASITAPIVVEIEITIGLDAERTAGMERRPTALVMMYPDDDARAAGLADFRSGGNRGDWSRLGIVLPAANTDALRDSL